MSNHMTTHQAGQSGGSPIASFRGDLNRMRGELKKALPPHVDVERFERYTMTAIQADPKLLQCDRRTLFQAITQCASDGLVPDGREATLTRFWSRRQGKHQAQYMPMVSGLIKLARQSGEVAHMTASVVYEGDSFRYWVDEQGEHLHHEPAFFNQPGQTRGVYAMARTTSGELYVILMRVDEVEQVRRASNAPDSGPWASWWGQMAQKTALRRLCDKRLPKSTDRLDQALSRLDDLYDFGGRKAIEGDSEDRGREAVKGPSQEKAIEALKGPGTAQEASQPASRPEPVRPQPITAEGTPPGAEEPEVSGPLPPAEPTPPEPPVDAGEDTGDGVVVGEPEDPAAPAGDVPPPDAGPAGVEGDEPAILEGAASAPEQGGSTDTSAKRAASKGAGKGKAGGSGSAGKRSSGKSSAKTGDQADSDGDGQDASGGDVNL